MMRKQNTVPVAHSYQNLKKIDVTTCDFGMQECSSTFSAHFCKMPAFRELILDIDH
jgi:hypothetical protein